MTRFGEHDGRAGRELVEEAVRDALRDADLQVPAVQAAFVGNAVAGLTGGQESIRGQVVLRRTGLLGVPVVNVENACASSSTALHLAWQAVAAGRYDCVVVVGYEKLTDQDRTRAVQALNASIDPADLHEVFGRAGRERSVYLDLYGSFSDGRGRDRFSAEALALVSVKNHRHGAWNPYCRYRREVTVDEVLGSRRVAGPLTLLMCSALSDGAACVVLSATAGGPGGCRPRIAASALASGRGDDLCLPSAVQRAAREASEVAGVGAREVDVVEVHDATSVAELHLYEELGLCATGEAERLVRDGVTWLGGALPVNPSGGMLARGHPIGATGLAQVVELSWQLRGCCGQRQVRPARSALAVNLGGWVGSDAAACCVHVLDV